MDFGKRVRQLRLERHMTKEELCQDEAELSVRQLTRIESGVSTPTLSKVEFIAWRLGVKVGELTDEEQFRLPERYKELKFLLLRTQTYLDTKRLRLREQYLEEIFEDFYDNLPEEEQLIVEILQSRQDILKSDGEFAAKKILHEYLEQIKHRQQYTVNDLILIELYCMYLPYAEFNNDIYNRDTHKLIIEHLLDTDRNLNSDELFVLNKTISSMASSCIFLEDKHNLHRLISKMENLMVKIQDFQRMHILNLLKWKYYLLDNNLELAKKYHIDACLFSSLTQDKHLSEKLEKEWQHDLSKFS